MARYVLMTLALLMFSAMIYAQTSLGGKVTEESSGEPIIYGSVAIYKDGNLITGTDTDLDGNYNFANIDPGTYTVEVSYVGFASARVEGVIVYAGKANKLDVQLIEEGITLQDVVVTAYKVPLIEADNTTQGRTITSDEIRQLPTRNINTLAANTAGLASADDGDKPTIKGSRTDATYYYVDGIRVQGALLPESEIDQLQVITGGIEAQYGDVTGGVISITSKGPSNTYTGSVEVETSEYLDPYKNSLVGFALSGPIAKKQETGESILGFRIAGRYTYQYDDDPPAIPVYRVTDEKLKEIEAKPIVPFGINGVANAGEFLTQDDVEALEAKPFEDRNLINFTGKIDARFNENIDMSFTGAYSRDKDRFTPGIAGHPFSWRLLNSHNNPYQTETDYRVNVRFRHRLGNTGSSSDEDKAGKTASIQNTYYILQGGYEVNTQLNEDVRHGDNFFDYGHIGNFEYEWVPSISNDLVHEDYSRTFRGFTPGTANPVLAAYKNVADEDNSGEQNIENGQISNLFDAANDFHTNVGWVYNLYGEENSDIITGNITGGFDFLPGGSETGRHNIQFGFMWEQRVNRKYNINPFELWQLGNQLANVHILGIDTSRVIDTMLVDGTQVPIYDVQINQTQYDNSSFAQKVRAITGQEADDYVNVDAIDPSQMSLSMFSAREINDQNYLDYYGYDYLGNEYNGEFNDFFTARNAANMRTFPVAPNRPIYNAAYIQDKFTFKDIIFRLGLRVERYDANTKVLKDPYSLYEIMGAENFHGEYGGERPGNIGEDYKVYVTDQDGESVKAYRNGEQWYTPEGIPVNDARLIFESGGLVYAKYQSEEARANPATYIKSEEFDPNVSLKDYEVQVNWMPRLAFSFPISDQANFFAHYDILVQRPASNNIVTALNYYYFIDNFENGRRGIPKNNAALLPERTVDYEVGFQQRLSNSSALKIAAYYKEIRDLIQRRTYLNVAELIQYDTYDNQDYATVKGFTFQYDLRRTGNISANVAYTLQFADGTGSDPNSQRGLTSRGNLRTLFPLSFDERHRVVATMDYRYQSGNKYNGPRIGGIDIFADAGLNLQAIAVSGRPYTKKEVPAQFGGDGTVGAINGARLPWNFTLNLRVDKNFTLGKGLDLNVYCRISNVLDTRNWINVYPASGSPNDDGFLESSRGADVLRSLEASNRDLDLYFNSYQWRMLNSDYYSLPRRIFIGAIFGF